MKSPPLEQLRHYATIDFVVIHYEGAQSRRNFLFSLRCGLRRLCGCEFRGEIKCCPLAQRALGPKSPTKKSNQAFGNRQTKPSPAVAASCGSIRLFEGIEDLRELVRRDSNSSVVDLKDKADRIRTLRLCRAYSQQDFTLFGELHRVA